MSNQPAATPAEHRQVRFEAPPGATGILLVRHGESAAAIEGVSFDLLDGQGDPPLHPTGREQAEAVGVRLGVEPIPYGTSWDHGTGDVK